MHEIWELNDASESYSASGRSARPALAKSQAELPGMGQGAYFPASGSAPAPEGDNDALPAPEAQMLKRWVYISQDEHGCSLKRARRAWPPSTRDSRAAVLLLTEQNYPLATLDCKRDRLRILTQGWVLIVLAGSSQVDFINWPLSKYQNLSPKPQQDDMNKQSWRITSGLIEI